MRSPDMPGSRGYRAVLGVLAGAALLCGSWSAADMTGGGAPPAAAIAYYQNPAPDAGQASRAQLAHARAVQEQQQASAALEARAAQLQQASIVHVRPSPSPPPSTTAPAPPPQTSQPGPAPSGDPQSYAAGQMGAYGWDSGQMGCLIPLWNQESGWNVYASNPQSYAYGIPQALPGDKMASAGPDWQTSYVTQITWGLGYIRSNYGSPCGAWAHEQADGWY
jgi:hypothetical protein